MAINDLMLNPNDLLGFTQQVRQSDPFGIAAQSLNAFQPDTRSFSAGELGATAFGKSFLSGLLGNYANERANRQLSSVVQALPLLEKNPYGMTTPEGVDSGAFNLLRGSAILKKAQKDAVLGDEKKTAIADLWKSVVGKAVETGAMSPQAALKAIETGDTSALEATDATKNPNSPQYKLDKDLADIERKYTETLLTGTAAKEAMNINRAATNILEAVKKDNPLAASTAIFEFAKLQDPTGTVREGDELRVSDPGGPLGTLARTFNEIQQKGKLTADGKKAMRELVPVLQKNTFQQYDQIKGGMLDAAKAYGADTSRIQYVKPTDLTPYLQDTPLIPVEIKSQIQSEYLSLKSKIGADAAKAQIAAKYPQLR